MSDSEIRMDDGTFHDDFSKRNRSWDDSGTIISDTQDTYQKSMGPGCQIYNYLIEWIGLYIHVDKNTLNNPKKTHLSKCWEKTMDVSNKNTKTKMTAMPRSIDSNGRWTIFYWKIDTNRDWKNLVFHHSSLFLSLSNNKENRPSNMETHSNTIIWYIFRTAARRAGSPDK